MLAAELNKNKEIIHPDSGTVLLRMCFQLLLFFKQSAERKKRQAIIELLEEHTQLTGDIYRWTINPQTCRFKRLTHGKSSYLEPKDWLLDQPPEEWEFLYHAGVRAVDASDIEARAFGRDYWGDQEPTMASYLLFQFPLNFFKTPDDFAMLTHNWSTRLQPIHGYAGFCLARSHGEEHGIASSFEYLLAQRFPGLDVRSPIFLSGEAGNCIKGADWLTILSDEYVNILGGKDIIKQAMGELPVLEYEGGMILRAGEGPQLGDAEQKIELTDYKRVGSVVEPVRCKNINGIHIGSAPHPRFTPESYSKWLGRFSPVLE